jgi:indolepyruvate ferredoxin oxidoreductase beta subunit
MNRLDKMVNKGRRVRLHKLTNFSNFIYASGAFAVIELKHFVMLLNTIIEKDWINKFTSFAPDQYELAVEIVKCRRLIKGYSDTHVRGLSKFDRVLSGANLVSGRDDAAKWVERLREAALMDEKGEALDGGN